MKLKMFSESLFRVCPTLQILVQNIDLNSAISHFQNYKSVIPVRGAIILNKKMTKVLLVKGWKSNATWGFPRGKINKDEPDDLCAIREVYEEIGFDISPYLNPTEFVDITVRQKNFKLYIVHGIPGSAKFCPQTRKEISKIEWHDVDTLPAFSSQTKASNVPANQYFLVAPFMSYLAKYIAEKKGLSSKISDSEASALKKLLGVTHNTDGSGNMVDRQTQVDDLLNILNSSSKSMSSNDRNLLSGMFPKLGQESEATDSQIDKVKDALSFYQTQVERKEEEAALQKASEAPIVDSSLPVENKAGTTLPPVLHPQMLPPQPIPMGYIMQPNGPIPVMPFPQAIPGPMNIPYPAFQPFPMPPVPNTLMPAGQSQPIEQSQMPRPDQLPEPSRPQAQPNKALLALVAKSKTKKQTPLSHSVASTHEYKHLSGPSSSSKALLSLLQKPKPTPPTPPPAIIPDSVSKPESKPDNNVLLDMLKPKNDNVQNQEHNANKPEDESQMLLAMIRGNQPSTQTNPPHQPSAQASLKDDSSVLLGMLQSGSNVSAEPAPISNPPFQNPQVSIKDAVFGSQFSSSPNNGTDDGLTKKMNVLTVADLESRHFNANNVSSSSHPQYAQNSMVAGTPQNYGSSTNAGKELLSLIQGGQGLQAPVEHNLPAVSNEYSSNNLPRTAQPSEISLQSQPTLLNAVFASAEAANNNQYSSSHIPEDPSIVSVNQNSAFTFPEHANQMSPSMTPQDSLNMNAGTSLLSLLRGNGNSKTNSPDTINAPKTELASSQYGSGKIRMPSVSDQTSSIPNTSSSSSSLPYPAGPKEPISNQALEGLDSPNAVHMPQEPSPYPQDLPSDFPNEDDQEKSAGQKLLDQMFAASHAELSDQHEDDGMIKAPHNLNSIAVAGSDNVIFTGTVAGEMDLAGSQNQQEAGYNNPAAHGGNQQPIDQMPEFPSANVMADQNGQQTKSALQNQDQNLMDFLQQYSTGSI